MSKTIRDLYPVILEKTEARKIPWVSETESLLSAKLPDGHSLSLQRDFVGYNIALRDEKNIALDTHVVTLGDSKGLEAYARLFEKAKRQALNVDVAIDRAEKSLLQL